MSANWLDGLHHTDQQDQPEATPVVEGQKLVVVVGGSSAMGRDTASDVVAGGGHDPGRFEEFGRRYRVELQGPRQAEALSHLRGLAKDRRLTLLTGTRQPEISEAAVLAALLRADHNG
jgi:hypothetical protein